MNDGKFAAALIKDTTQVVLMDEWTPECLGCDDAKRILEGKLMYIILFVPANRYTHFSVILLLSFLCYYSFC